MWRTIGGIVAGFVAWALIVTVLNFGLRLWLPGYVQVEHAMLFTLPMKIARLSIAAVTSLVAGAVIRAVAPTSRWAPWIVGVAILALFLPTHIYLWSRFRSGTISRSCSRSCRSWFWVANFCRTAHPAQHRSVVR